jgi:hypothetical protein
MNWYINLVTTQPILTAIVQFAILGTLGEIISRWIIQKSLKYPFTFGMTLWKMVVWSVLAVCIKYAFIGTDGFVQALINHKSADLKPDPLLPQMIQGSIAYAFTKSVLINLQFGLFLVLFHRILDNLVLEVKNWKNLDKGMLSLLWFWIPAHTVTFSLPKDYQIGLAALWSVVLGFILGMFNRK